MILVVLATLLALLPEIFVRWMDPDYDRPTSEDE